MTDYNALLDAPIDDLLAEIGHDLTPEPLGPRSRGEYAEAGRKWLEEHRKRLRDRLCPERRQIESGPSLVDVAAGIADALASIEGVPAVACVSVVIARFGLAAFYEGEAE